MPASTTPPPHPGSHSRPRPGPGPGRTNRRRAAALTEITEIAGGHLARGGIGGLSLRAIAREMGMVPSGIYRHVANRDELLTLLVGDGYRRLADAVDAAVDRHPSSPRAAFLAACRAVRSVARADPHRHALLYGTPVPGYEAPPDTTVEADRLYRALLRPITAAPPAPGSSSPVPPDRGAEPPSTSDPAPSAAQGDGFDLHVLRRLAPGIPANRAALALDSWAALFGHLSLELFGHHRGTVTDADRFFERSMERQADRLGLADIRP